MKLPGGPGLACFRNQRGTPDLRERYRNIALCMADNDSRKHKKDKAHLFCSDSKPEVARALRMIKVILSYEGPM